jgi:curved DNA-binding protein CbpA
MLARQVLGVSENASDDEIRAAYLEKVKQYPPEREPEEFERVRDAYETLRDPRKRARDMLLAAEPFAPLASLFDGVESERQFVGPGPWREVLKHR